MPSGTHRYDCKHDGVPGKPGRQLTPQARGMQRPGAPMDPAPKQASQMQGHPDSGQQQDIR